MVSGSREASRLSKFRSCYHLECEFSVDFFSAKLILFPTAGRGRKYRCPLTPATWSWPYSVWKENIFGRSALACLVLIPSRNTTFIKNSDVIHKVMSLCCSASLGMLCCFWIKYELLFILFSYGEIYADMLFKKKTVYTTIL